MVRLTINVMMAVFRNYALIKSIINRYTIPNFYAILIVDSVFVEFNSISVKILMTTPSTKLINEIITEAMTPSKVIAIDTLSLFLLAVAIASYPKEIPRMIPKHIPSTNIEAIFAAIL